VGILLLVPIILATLPPTIVTRLLVDGPPASSWLHARATRFAAAAVVSVGWIGLLVIVSTSLFPVDPPLSLQQEVSWTLIGGCATSAIVAISLDGRRIRQPG
jgi:hypothetical protein